MSTAKQYVLSTTGSDQTRLEILNKLYNPAIKQFLLDSGLKPGMHVLEVGCGIGEMACWLAQQVGKQGSVTVIDISSAHLQVTQEKANNLGLSNMQFIELDVRNIENLDKKFDLIYWRWVLWFFQNPQKMIKNLIEVLNINGMLVAEEGDPNGNGHYSYPYNATVESWFQVGKTLFSKTKVNLELGSSLYNLFSQFGLDNIKVKLNQPVLITPEEKSVLRLGRVTMKDALIEKDILSELEYEQHLKQLSQLETMNVIIGFIRNHLVSGVKLKD